MRYVTFETAGDYEVHVHEAPTPYKCFLIGYPRLFLVFPLSYSFMSFGSRRCGNFS